MGGRGRSTIVLEKERDRISAAYLQLLACVLLKSAQEIQTDLWRLKGKGLAKAYMHRSCMLLHFSWFVLH